jgi:rhamnulokinase
MSSYGDRLERSGKKARIAIDLGAESCRVSLLRWRDDKPEIELIHRIANGPVLRGTSLRWPLQSILQGLEAGLRMAAQAAPEGVASIAVDGWAVDYVRLDADGQPLADPYCYRDQRTISTKERADQIFAPDALFARAGAQPLRINSVYQFLADPGSGIDPNAPWVSFPEYVLYWLGAPRVAEYTNATHSGLLNPHTGDWDAELFKLFGIPLEAAPPVVPAGTVVGSVTGPLAQLDAFRGTQLIAPACHDTASAIAGIGSPLDSGAYIASGTWSLVGALVPHPVLSLDAMRARYTNQGAAAGGFCFHSNVNGMWLIKQCLDSWANDGRPWKIEELVERAANVAPSAGTIDVDAEPLLLDGQMPQRINRELELRGLKQIEDVAGNEPLFARLVFESLATRYADALSDLRALTGRKVSRIHVLGGGSRNRLLTELTAQRTGLPVEIGEPESSTVGNFAVQLATIEANGKKIDSESLRWWAALISGD